MLSSLIRQLLVGCFSVVVMLSGQKASAGPADKSAVSASALAVVDANGKPLGRLMYPLPLPGSFAVLMTLQSVDYGVPVIAPRARRLDKRAMEFLATDILYFNTTDCTGAAQSDQQVWGVNTGALIKLSDGRILFYPHSATTSVNDSPANSRFINGFCETFAAQQVGNWVITGNPIDLTTMFTPPFRIR